MARTALAVGQPTSTWIWQSATRVARHAQALGATRQRYRFFWCWPRKPDHRCWRCPLLRIWTISFRGSSGGSYPIKTAKPPGTSNWSRSAAGPGQQNDAPRQPCWEVLLTILQAFSYQRKRRYFPLEPFMFWRKH